MDDNFNMGELELPTLDALENADASTAEPTADLFVSAAEDEPLLTPVDTAPASEPVQTKPAPVLDDFSDMGAYTPADKYQPAPAPKRAAPKPDDFSDFGAYTPADKYQAPTNPAPSSPYNLPSNNQAASPYKENPLDEMYARKQAHHDKGERKATTLGVVVIALTLIDAFSSLSSGGFSMVISILFAAGIIFCAIKFIRGSGRYRVWLGRLSLIDFIYSIINAFRIKSAIDILNTLTDSQISAAPYIAFAVFKIIGYGVFTYFFLLDKEIADYADDD